MLDAPVAVDILSHLNLSNSTVLADKCMEPVKYWIKSNSRMEIM